MGYVKRKCSNAGKVPTTHFEELQEVFLADVTAVAIINNIPDDLGPNCSSVCTDWSVDDA